MTLSQLALCLNLFATVTATAAGAPASAPASAAKTAAAGAECSSALSEIEDGLALAAADFFEKNRRVPMVAELKRVLPKDAAVDERDLVPLIIDVARAKPGIFRDLKSRAAQKVMHFALARYRWPDEDEILPMLGWRVEDDEFARLAPAVLGTPREFRDFARTAFPEFTRKIQGRLSDAYLRAFSQRERPKHLRTQKFRPSEEAIFDRLTQARGHGELGADVEAGKFTLDTFRKLIGSAEAGPDDLVVVGGGVAEIEQAARLHAPARFANFRAPEINDLSQANRLKEALEEKAGFLVTSVNAGIDLDEAQLATMLRYAEDLDYDIIVYPTNNMMEGLDSRLLTNPRIHVLTHTIKNRYFKLYNIGLMPKNANPFASLNKHRQFLPGQLTIVGHPQLRFEVHPTSSNHLREAAHWSTGSLSKNYYPFDHYVQDRTSRLAHNYHTNSFLVLEKADAASGFNGRGVENFWHVRPVVFKNHEKDEHHGFTDLGRYYYVADGEVRVGTQWPEAAVKGDLHEAETDQNFIVADRDFYRLFPPGSLDLVLHDSLSNNAISPHEFESLGILVKKFLAGELNLADEINGLIQYINAVLAYEAIKTVYNIDSNHTYWLPRLLDKVTALNAVINGREIAEYTWARDFLGYKELLEYILRDREGIHVAMPPEIKRRLTETQTYVHAPERVSVVPKGDSLFFGPTHRPVALHNHGHQGANGARGSTPAHASGQEWSVTGDSHRTGIVGGNFSVGTSTPKRVSYNGGGYSSWTNSSALVYPDGTIQLVSYHTKTNTMFPRPNVGTLPPEDFFGDDPLRIELNDNELMQGAPIVDQFSRFYDRGDRNKAPSAR